MISWVVASHDPAIRAAYFGPAIPHLLAAGDQVQIIEGAASIAEAYTAGTEQAQHPVRCYIHHDVRILDVPRLRAALLDTLLGTLLDTCRPDVGIVGVIGSTAPQVPWWEGPRCGSVLDGRLGLLDFGPGGHPAAYLDGLLLASAQELTWDTSYQGWHLYDHDICQQQLAAGRANWCLPDGHHLVEHHTAGPASTAALTGWDAAVDRFTRKWPNP